MEATGEPRRTGGSTSGLCERATRMAESFASSSSPQRMSVSMRWFSSRASREPADGEPQPYKPTASIASRDDYPG